MDRTRGKSGGVVQWRLLVLLASCGLICSILAAAEPDWWAPFTHPSPPQVLNPKAVATVGQLKNVAATAMQKMVENGYGPGADISALVAGWRSNPISSDHAALSLGQLKAVGKKFYDRRAELGLAVSGHYPWNSSGNNRAVVTIGELKQVFAFDLPVINATLSIQSGSPQTVVIGQAAAAALVVKAVNAQGGAALPNWPVTFSVDAGQISMDQTNWSSTPITTTTGTDGQAHVYYLAGSVAQNASVIATLGIPGARVTFSIATVLPFDVTPLSSLNGHGAAGSLQELQIRVTDHVSGAPLAAKAVHYQISSGSGASLLDDNLNHPGAGAGQDCATDLNGCSWVYLQLPLADGETVQMTATVPGMSGNGIVFARTVSTTASPVLAMISGDGQFAQPGTSLAQSLQVQYRDATGSPVAGAPVSFVSSGDGVLSASTVNTDDSGMASVNFQVSSTGGITSVVGVSSSYIADTSGTQFHASSYPNNSLITLSGDQQGGLPGTLLALPVQVQLTPGLGQSLSGNAVVFSLVLPAGVTPPAGLSSGRLGASADSLASGPFTAYTDANGNAQVVAELPMLLGATVTIQAVYQSLTASATAYTGTIAPSISIQSGDLQSGAASSVLPSPLVVLVLDGLGTPIPSRTVTFSNDSGTLLNSSGTVTNQATTDANGLATIWYRMPATLANDINVTASIALDAGGTASTSFRLEPVEQGPLNIAIGSSGNNLTGNPGDVLTLNASVWRGITGWRSAIGVPVTFSVTAGDAWLAGGDATVEDYTKSANVNADSGANAQISVRLPWDYGVSSTISAEVEGGAHVEFTVSTASLGSSNTSALGSQVRLGRIKPSKNLAWEQVQYGPTGLTASGSAVAVVDDMVIVGGPDGIQALQRSFSSSTLSWSWAAVPSRLSLSTPSTGGEVMSYDPGTGLLAFAKRSSTGSTWPVGTLQLQLESGQWNLKHTTSTLDVSLGASYWSGSLDSLTSWSGGVLVSFRNPLSAFAEFGFADYALRSSEWADSMTNSTVSCPYVDFLGWKGRSSLASFGPLVSSGIPLPSDQSTAVYDGQHQADTTQLLADGSVVNEAPVDPVGDSPGAAVAVSAHYLAVGSVPNGNPIVTNSSTVPGDRSCTVLVYAREHDSWQFLQDITILDASENFSGGELSLAFEDDRLVVAAYAGNRWLSNVGVGSARLGTVDSAPTTPSAGTVLEHFKVVSFTPDQDGLFALENTFMDDQSHTSTASSTRPSSLYYRDFSLATDHGLIAVGFPTKTTSGQVQIFSELPAALDANTAVDTEVATIDASQCFPGSPAGYQLVADNSAFKVVNIGGDHWSVQVNSSPLTATAGAQLAISVQSNGSANAPAFLARKVWRYKVNASDLAAPANLVAVKTTSGGTTTVNLSCTDQSQGETQFVFYSRTDTATDWTSGTITVASTTSQQTGATISATTTVSGSPLWIDYQVRAAQGTSGAPSGLSPPSQTVRIYLSSPDGTVAATDTDGDGVPDSVEIAEGTDPNDPNSSTWNPLSAFVLLIQTPLKH